MFVLCPHCHFLVGIDPRTGKPPAACPKCGGVVVEPLPESHVEDVLTKSVLTKSVPAEGAAATPLAPFAPVELPSVASTLPEPELEPGLEPAPATPEPRIPGAPAPASPAAIETAATPQPTSRLWRRTRTEPAIAPAPAVPAAPVQPRATKPESPPASVATPSPAEPASLQRADAMIAAMQGRRRATRKTAEPPRVEPPAVVAAVEVEVDALPPAVQGAAVVATATVDATIDSPLEPVGIPVEAPVEAPVAIAAKRQRQAPATTAADTAPAATAAAIESTVPDAGPVDMAPDGAVATLPHPLRRRTDFDPTAVAEAIPGSVPPHPLRRRTDAPSFTRPRVRANVASRIGWRSLAAVGGLSLLLVLQLLLAQRDTLAASPRWRPTIAAACATLRCDLPPWREPAAFTMLSRDVRPHPNAPGTLLINASFRNDARWPQPWPRLLLTLSDLDGRMVGARSFAAGEYLGTAPTQPELVPGQTAAVTLSVVEPAPNIVAFTFDFR